VVTYSSTKVSEIREGGVGIAQKLIQLLDPPEIMQRHACPVQYAFPEKDLFEMLDSVKKNTYGTEQQIHV
jgi:hypothetical protein